VGDSEKYFPRYDRSHGYEVAAMDHNVALAKTAALWPTHPNLDKQWEQFRANAKKNAEKPASDLTRLSPGGYCTMGAAMGKAVLELLK
jgi:hypothetical protein